MSKPQLLALAGSARIHSFNKQLVRIAAKAGEQAGAEVTFVDLRDYPLPLFDEEFERETGTPDNAAKLKQLFLQHQGLLIASPEYNSSITPLLKNTIDWVSRTAPGEPALAAYQGKAAALMSASPGALGGLRGLVHVRAILSNLGVLVLPDQLAVPRAFEAFDAEGDLKDPKQRSQVAAIAQKLASLVGQLHP